MFVIREAADGAPVLPSSARRHPSPAPAPAGASQRELVAQYLTQPETLARLVDRLTAGEECLARSEPRVEEAAVSFGGTPISWQTLTHEQLTAARERHISERAAVDLARRLNTAEAHREAELAEARQFCDPSLPDLATQVRAERQKLAAEARREVSDWETKTLKARPRLTWEERRRGGVWVEESSGVELAGTRRTVEIEIACADSDVEGALVRARLLPGNPRVIVTPHGLSEEAAERLARAGVKPFVLGERYRQFLAARETGAPAAAPEI